jgi:hypothetical protein
MMYDAHNKGNEGTIAYKGNWQMLDQIIVSPELLIKGNGYFLSYDDGKVYKGDGVLFTDPQTKAVSPNRTYEGNTYFGGVSDHLPVFVILGKSQK